MPQNSSGQILAWSLPPGAMIPAQAPGTWSSPPLLLVLSLSLVLLFQTVCGDCGPPPDIPNARPILGRHSKFAEQSKVAYSCNNGFKQVPDKSNIVVCLENGQWSSHETFCEKSCDTPERLSFASLKKEYFNMNFFPVGTIVEYECRPGFRKQPSLSGKSTCLEDLVWSPVAQFCKKKSCPNPKDLDNGHINIPTGILFGSEINFSCNPGYRLVGITSILCTIIGNTVDWDDEFPVCTEIFCPDPPKINNGIMRGESDSYKYSQVVIYSCDKGFILFGNSTIYCTVSKSDVGQWSSPPPQCIEESKVPIKKPVVNVPSTGIPSTPQKPTTESVPNPGDQPTPQKPSTVKVPGTRVPAMPQKPTRVHVLSTRVPPMSQKPSMFNVPDTRVSPKPQKPTKANIPSSATLPTPQKTNTADVPVTEIPTLHKSNTAHVSATEIPPAPQKTNIAIVPATEASPTPKKANTDVPATEIPQTPQKTNIAIVQATVEASPIPQKTNTAKSSATNPATAQMSLISTTESTQ